MEKVLVFDDENEDAKSDLIDIVCNEVPFAAKDGHGRDERINVAATTGTRYLFK